MATTPTPIGALPTAPAPDQPQATFDANAYTWSAALPAWTTSANNLATNVYNNAVEAAAKATLSGTKADDAASSAQLADDWANKLTTTVDGTEYSAKEYAVGTVVESAKRHASGTTATGSAKEWAIKATSPDGTASKSAKSYSEDAAAQVTLAAGQVTLAQGFANDAAQSAIYAANSVEKYQGSLASDPTLDKQGNALTAGDWYINTTTGLIRAYTGTVWVNSISVTAGVSSVNGLTGDVTLPEGKNIFIQGDTVIVAGSTSEYQITNYDSFLDYSASVSAGSVSISADKIYITAPSTEQTIALTITTSGNASTYSIQVYEYIVDYGTDVDGLDSLITIQQDYNAITTYALDAIVIVRKSDRRFVEYKSLQANNTGNNPETSPTFWQLVYDNNANTSGYLGEVLGSTCVVDKGEWKNTTAYSIGDMVVVKNIPTPLKQSDLTAYVAKTANTNKPPASNPADWEQRNALPTGTSLAQTLGIGNTTSEVLINNDSGWLKFVHQGKIKYIAKKPFMHTVSWNDIAKAEAVYGNRTVRIGSRLYRVSLLSGAEADPSSWITTSTATDNKGAGSEWNSLVYRVHNVVPTDGAATNHGGKQVGSNWWNFTDADMVMTSGSGNGGFTWCKETPSFNTADRVTRGFASLSYFVNNASFTTTTNYGWRPCLTLISEPEADSALYNAEASGVGPSVASLQYDPITDTGYYGEVPAASFYTGTQISTATGVTAGTLQNDTEGWLKFYWHGQVLFIAKKTYRYNLNWDNINTANSVYGVNLGSTGKKTITHSGSSTSYDVKLMKGATKDPSPASGGGRQWNELLYRVCTGTETGEIGANWASLTPSTDLGINAGGGSYTWCQEVYQPNTADRVLRGGNFLPDFVTYTSSSAFGGGGWRPCLALVR